MRIRSHHNFLFLKSTFLMLVNLQAVAGGKKRCFRRKFFWSPPDKENTAKRTNSSPLKGPIIGPFSSSPNVPWYLIFALMQLQSNPHLRPPFLSWWTNDPFIDSCFNLCTKATHLYNGHFILSQRWLLCWGTTIGNLCFFIEIIRWPPWISWVRSTGLPLIFFRAFKKYSQLSLWRTL